MALPIVLYSYSKVRTTSPIGHSNEVDANILWKSKGANPWKVAMILEELDLPYETKFLNDFDDMKKKPYTDINPNGR